MPNQDGQSNPGQQGQDSGGSGRGFAGMDDQRQRDIAAEGGRSVPDDQRSFSKDRELASEAGRKGGEASGGGRGDAGSDDVEGDRGKASGGTSNANRGSGQDA